MNFYIQFLVFLIILFFYIHIVHQYKRSEDLEIYELDYSSNQNLQETCDVKQPILFEYKSINPDFYETISYDNIASDNYANYDIRVKETSDYWNSEDSVDYIVLPMSSGSNLMRTDTKSAYFSEMNEDFIEETGIISQWQENDNNLKPNFTLQKKYDIMLGSRGSYTPLRYHTNYRHYISVNSGKIRIKMTPFKSTKYLYQIKDFENYEFRSQIDVWNPQYKYRHDIDKIKFLEFDILEGFMIFIPPYWWYSIQYDNSSDTLLTGFTYNTAMNIISNIPYFIKYYIQQSNIKKRVAKVLAIDDTVEELQESTENNNNEENKE